MINLLSLGAPHAGGGAAVGVQQPSRDRTTFECFQASLPLHMACMVLGSSLPDRNSKKETVTDYISIVTAVGQPPTANRTPSAVTANPARQRQMGYERQKGLLVRRKSARPCRTSLEEGVGVGRCPEC